MINRSVGEEDRVDGGRKFRSDSKEFREAKEVFLFMNKNVRISRDLRARWFFEHLDRLIRLDFDANEQQPTVSKEKDVSDTFGVAVMGLVPKTGPPLKENEKLRIATTTHITYFSKFYCLIFILDVSPSCFVSDESGCVLYTRLVESVAKCVKNVTKKFKFAGSNNTFMPRIYATFCAFTPFLCFPENSILLQSVLLDENNVNSVVEFLYKRIKVFIDKLCIFAQPHMKEWNRKRRKFRKTNEDDIVNLFEDCSINFDDAVPSKQQCESTNVLSPDMLDVDTHKNSMSDQGFIQPDWALIFMLRMGLMGVQMCLADNIQSNIIIVTDGVCGIPDTQALQHVLSQMRSFSISCSFIQLHQSLRGPTLGHVGFPELFHFLSTATFGSFLTENQLDEDSPPSTYSIFHRSFLAWSFQRALVRNSSLPDLIPKGLRTTHVRNRRMSRVYETTLCRLLYVRLREGYTIKHVDIQRRCEESETIVVKLCLVWKPQIFIEYIINAPWKSNPQRKCKIHVDVFVDAIANSTIEMLSDFQESDSIKSVILSLNDADCLMLHLHLFNCDFHYYHLPKEFDEYIPFFEYRKNFQRPILNQRYENLKNSKFISFWQPLCVLDERIWQKWAHTHTIRIILNHDLPLPDKIFTPSRNKGRFAGIFSEEAFQALHRALKESSTFTLVKEQSYVSLIYDNDGEERVPKYFYIVKTSIDMPFVILKVAFLGGVPGPIRKKIVDDLKSELQKLKISRENLYAKSADATSSSPPNYNSAFCQSFAENWRADVLFIVRKPLERILIKYRRLPRILHQLVRLERSEKLRENKEMILHNAIAKYLSCRRQIWHLRGVFLKNVALSNDCLEFILQTLMRRRLNQGFHITYGKNAVVNLVRQRNVNETISGNVRVEQCVLFGPTLVEEPFMGKNAIKKSRKHSLNVEEERAEKFTTLDSNESVLAAPWTQIVTEVWTEPRDHVKTVSERDPAAELLEENGIVIRVLFTFEQWQNACTSRVWVEKPLFYVDGKSNENVDEVIAHQNTSPAVDCIFNAFSLKELLEQANEKEVMFLPALGFCGDPHSVTRLSMLLSKLQKDLADSYDACVEVSEECIPQCIVQAMCHHFASEEFCNNEANTPGNPNSPTSKPVDIPELVSIIEQKGNVDTAALKFPLSPTATQNPATSLQLSSPTVRRSSVSPPPSSNSSSSFPFETPAACSPNLSGSRQNVTVGFQNTSNSNRCRFVYKDVEQELDTKSPQFYPENFSHSSYLETLCEHRSTSVPLLLTAEKNLNAGLSDDVNSSSFLPPSIAFSGGICGHDSNQVSAFNPVPRKSTSRAPVQHWELPMGKLRPTTTTPFLTPNKSISNVTVNESGSNQTDGCNTISQETFVSVKKKHSVSAFSNDELSSNTQVSIQVPPTKKYSAPPVSTKCHHKQKKGHGIDRRSVHIETADELSETDEKCCSLKLFAKRLNNYRLIFLMVPKDVKAIQIIAPLSLKHNMFPVFVFHCDKARVAQNLSTPDWDYTKWGNVNDVLVDSFCRKAETSTLAHLQQQINRRSKREERKANNIGTPLEFFFANAASSADGNSELISDREEPVHTTFDLANYCELVFEEYIYTKCYIATVYSCLGQEIFVPPFVLHEVMDYRCEHIRVEIGSINEILSDTCIHMKRGRNSQRVGRRASGASKYQRRKSQKLFSSSSSSSTSTSSALPSEEDDQTNFDELMANRTTLSAADFKGNKRIEVLFKENGECQWESDNDSEKRSDSDGSADICEDELSDFRQSFDDLLKQHSFIKVPGLNDYFFYWPQPINLLNPYKMLDRMAEAFGTSILATGFENSSSQGKHFPHCNYVRDSSRRTSASISSLSKRRDGARNSDQNDYLDSVTFAHHGSNESSDVGEYYEGIDEIAESEKSSLPDELSGTNNWPLFIQFSASVYVDGQVYSFSIEFIPNCLKDIFKKCSSLLQGNQLVDLSNIEVNIDMYVFTWPLPSQCPYQESGQFFDGNATTMSYNIGGGRGNGGNAESYDSSMVSSDFLGQPPQKSFPFTQALNRHSIIHEDDFDDENDDIFEQPVEILRQIPVHEHRVLRKIQRNIQRMLKMEYILIMSREFDRKPKDVTLRRVMRFISEEIGHTSKTSGTMEAGDGRFELMCKDLVLVTEPQVGLQSLFDRFANLKVDYCTLKRFPPRGSSAKATKASDNLNRRTYGKHVSKFLNNKIDRERDVLFYSCGVDSADGIAFAHTRHKLIKKPLKEENANVRAPEANEFIPIRDEEFVKEKMMSGSSIIAIPRTQLLAEQVSETGSQCTSNSTMTISAFNDHGALNAFAVQEAADGDNDEVLTTISVDEDEALSDITMPLNDLTGLRPSITARINDALMTKSKVRHHLRTRHGGKHLIHDFWLILQVVQKEDGTAHIKIYFCQRSPLIHTQLFSKACQVVEEQIKIVNQEFLLERMHLKEECDQLLVDVDTTQNIPDYQQQYQSQTSREAADEHYFDTSSLSKHASRFVQRPSRVQEKGGAMVSNSISISDEEEPDAEGEISDLVRYKYAPGHFACDMMWHFWFPIHPRLKSANSDNGFMALRFGLEWLAVRNRNNMYVYRERSGNVVYMRLHCSEESVFANIALKSESWREEVLENINHCILLSVHGVKTPGDEITDELKSVLQRRLNIKTLEEIQKALLKNAHIRLEWSDIKFIQSDVQHPSSICYFTIPVVAQHHLVAIKHYLTQQLQTFCILPKFREQSGMYGGQHSSHHLPSLKSHSSSGDFSTTSTMIGSCDALSASDFMPTYHGTSSTYRPVVELKRCHTSGLGTPPLLVNAPPLAFVSYVMPDMPPNPINYAPTFFLFNKPAGVGTRDTGIACLEMKLVGWDGAVIENFQEAGFCPSSRSLLYPGVPNADRLHRAARFHELSKCVQISQLSDGSPIPGTCALFQFNIWKNGNVEVDELQARLKMCAQQAISDLITEFGLLSAPIFESNANCRSTASSFSFPAPPSSTTSITPSSFTVGGTTPTANEAEKGCESMAFRIAQLQRQNAQDLESKRAFSTAAEVMPSCISIEYSGKPPMDIGQPIVTPTKPLAHSAAQVQSEPNLIQQRQQRQFTNESSTDSLFSRKSQHLQGGSIADSDTVYDKLQIKTQDSQSALHHPHPLISPSTIGVSQTIADLSVAESNTSEMISHATIQQRQLPAQDPPLSTMADQSSHNFYQYFHNVTNPKLSPTNPMPSQQQVPLMSSSAALVYATSAVSPFAIPSQTSLIGASGITSGSGQISVTPSSDAIPTRPTIQSMQHHSNSSSGGASSAVPGSFDGVDHRFQQHQQNFQRGGLGNQLTPINNEFLRIDFVAAAAEWFDHVNSKTKGFAEMNHSVRKFNFLLDCDGSARKIIQVIYERLKLLLRTEKVVLCRSPPETTHNAKHLQTLLSVTPLLEPFDKDFGRVVFIDDDYRTDLVLVAFPEQQCLDTLRYGHDISSAIPTCLHKLADGAQSSYSKFLPSLRPFVPRQRILYLILRGENITLFLYNYTNEVVLRVKEIVERAILWHNARSRLLREIGLHKMGITHLSTLKSSDSKYNSYLLLTWMNPEILVRNDYPIENLTTPDFAKLPRPYSQFLLKLYRFSDPAFVAKNLNAFPFEDQTQQMLTLREDVRSMLNEHRIFQEIHKQLLNQQSELSEDFFSRIIGRSRQVHYVQSPLLLFPSWRRIIASVRTGSDSYNKHIIPSLARFSANSSAARECPKGRSKTVNMGHYDTFAHGGMPLTRMLSHDEEPCLLKIQHMLIYDYVAYLKIMGLNIINFIHTNKRIDNSLSRSVHYESAATSAASDTLSSGGSVGNRAQYHHQNFPAAATDETQPPNVWMYLALEGGILFVQLCFVEPYFYVRILQWNNSNLVVIPNSANFTAEVENLKKLERKKNELVQKCHVHSFTYDFHLRMVSRYLIGGKHVLFNSGYNTNGFLVDFLQYYECRPPNARNCLYEETVKCNQLQVGQANIWEYFLDNKSQFGWNVVRLKSLDLKTTDEFMIVSKEDKQLLKQPYQFVRIVLNNNYNRTVGGVVQQKASGSGNSSSADSNSKYHEMALKFYVLLVTEEKTYPITDELKRDFIDVDGSAGSQRNQHPSGEFTRIARNPTVPPFSTSPTAQFSNLQSEAAADRSKPKFVHEDSASAFRNIHAHYRHHQNHRGGVGAKFSYCCDSIDTQEEELAEDAGLYQKEPIAHSMSLAERRSVAGRLKIASSASEIIDDERNFLFGIDDDADSRKRFSSGGNLLPVNRRQQNLSPKTNVQKLSLGSIRRNSDAPSLLPTSIGGALPNLTKFFTSNMTPPLDADSSASDAIAAVGVNASASVESDKFKNDSPTSFSPLQHSQQQQQISFQKVPPRRHYRFYQDISMPFHERGAVVPPEQVIYLHYLSGVQRKLQSCLEMVVEEKREELLKFILEADKLCYVDVLWKSLLSSKSTHIRRQPATLFSAATTSKSDLATSSESSTLALQKSIKLSGSVEMDPSDFSALLGVVRMEPMVVEEPRLNRILADVNFANLCRFLLHYYESEHRCRYFTQNHKTYLIITNPSFLDSAAMFRNDSKSTEIFFLFKNLGVSKAENEPFSTNAIHKLFEDVMSCLSAFTWSELLHNLPLLS